MRVKRGYASRRRHNRLRKRAEGFRGRRGNCFQFVKNSVTKALQHAFRDRRAKKRDFRRLWIIRINAGARSCGMTYGALIRGLKLADVQLDRKNLADLAMNDPKAFSTVVERAKQALAA